MPKYVELQSLLAGLPRSGTMTTNAARALAHDILDACEAVDPTEEESEWERAAAQQDRERMTEREVEAWSVAAMLADRARAGFDDQAWRSEVMRMGLDLREPTPHCVQFIRAGKVHAEWWPSRGTTMHAQKRGPVCRDSKSLVRWLRTLV